MRPDPSPTPLPRKEFNKHLDSFMLTGQLNPEVLEECDLTQQIVLNEVKKSFVRIKNKYESDRAQ